ncbi:MAG: hypothetical protein HY320_08645 [Armatimonadetes bacterium]|nr:hypothetical protein [Armatimonadota bacterium]
MIAVHHFQDVHTFDAKKAGTCCVHYALPSGELVPFCVYNNLWRGRDVGHAREAPDGDAVPLLVIPT